MYALKLFFIDEGEEKENNFMFLIFCTNARRTEVDKRVVI